MPATLQGSQCDNGGPAARCSQSEAHASARSEPFVCLFRYDVHEAKPDGCCIMRVVVPDDGGWTYVTASPAFIA